MFFPSHFTSTILFGWSIYYLWKKTDFKKLKMTWKNFLKGMGLAFLSVLTSKFLNFLGGDVDINKVDGFFGIPLFIFTLIKAAQIFNKRFKPSNIEDKKQDE